MYRYICFVHINCRMILVTKSFYMAYKTLDFCFSRSKSNLSFLNFLQHRCNYLSETFSESDARTLDRESVQLFFTKRRSLTVLHLFHFYSYYLHCANSNICSQCNTFLIFCDIFASSLMKWVTQHFAFIIWREFHTNLIPVVVDT